MKYKLSMITVMLVFGLCLSTVNAQEVTLSSGGEATGSGGSASYSVGQLIYSAIDGDGGTAMQGVQMAYEISVVTAVKEARNISLNVAAYPNPAQEQLKLEIPGFETADMYWQLYDYNGRLITGDPVKGQLTRIDMSQQVPGTYILKIIRKGQPLKTLQIIKK